MWSYKTIVIAEHIIVFSWIELPMHLGILIVEVLQDYKHTQRSENSLDTSTIGNLPSQKVQKICVGYVARPL